MFHFSIFIRIQKQRLDSFSVLGDAVDGFRQYPLQSFVAGLVCHNFDDFGHLIVGRPKIFQFIGINVLKTFCTHFLLLLVSSKHYPI